MSTQVHGKALSVNKDTNSYHKRERSDFVMLTPKPSMDKMNKTASRHFMRDQKPVTSDNIVFPSDDGFPLSVQTTTVKIPNRVVFNSPDVCNAGEKKDNKGVCRKTVDDESERLSLSVETTTVDLPNRVIFNSPGVCNPGEKKDSKGRCRKTIVSRFDEDELSSKAESRISLD